jgi:hypothetical protein
MALDWMSSGFGWFECFLLFVVVGARNKLRSTLLIPTQILLNYFLAQNISLMTRSQISNLLLQLSVLFGSIEKLTLERATHIARRA